MGGNFSWAAVVLPQPTPINLHPNPHPVIADSNFKLYEIGAPILGEKIVEEQRMKEELKRTKP